jgi:hypothetical protein
MHSNALDIDQEHMHRGNLAEFVSGQGPVNIWVLLPKSGESMSLVGYLGSHKPALKLWVHMARHHAPIKEDYLSAQQDKASWQGGHLREGVDWSVFFAAEKERNQSHSHEYDFTDAVVTIK